MSIKITHIWRINLFGHPNSEPRARTSWNGWCVPSALAQFLWIWGDGIYKGVTLPHVGDSTFNVFHTRGNLQYDLRIKDRNTGAYEFYYDIENGGRENINSNGEYEPLVNKDAIKVLSERIDNGLYYDVVNALDVGGNWDGGSTATKGAQVIKELTNNRVEHVWLGGDGLNMHNHIKNRKGPAIDALDVNHARLLVGTKYYWYEHWNVWHTYYWYIKRWYKKWGWLWTAEWAQGSHRWETSVLSGEWGTKFLVWDNGTNTAPHGYVPYWENSTAVGRRDAIGFTY